MKLLPEYKGQKITAKAVSGFVTFDTNKVDESEYPAYYNLGFDFCFEPIEPKYKAPIKYVGIEQGADAIESIFIGEKKETKVNKPKNAKKVKTEGPKE
jgi:hypothetical protein